MSEQNGIRRFYEVQYFWQQPLSWIIWLVCIAGIFILNASGAIHGEFAIIIIVLIIGVLALVSFTQLNTEVSEEGISFRMKPFHRSWRKYSWKEIKSAHIREYKPLREYGGWGVRIGLTGRAYNIKGNKGLQIELVSGEKILLGTQQPEEIQDLLDELGRA